MTSYSWLWLLVGFVLPMAAYLLLATGLIRKQPKHQVTAACVAALISVLTVWGVVFSSPYWDEGKQVVWTGVRAVGTPLVVGGKPEEVVVGWPNDAPEPKLTVAATGSDQASIEIRGGGAFVFREGVRRPLNGTELAVGQSLQLDDYTLRVNRLGPSLRHLLKPEVEVLDAQGATLAGFALRPERTRSLRYLIAGTPMENLDGLQTDEQKEQAIVAREHLEEWASGVWLFRSGGDAVYVLRSGDSITHAVDASASLSVKWVNLTLPVKVSAQVLGDGATQARAEFAPPWRLSSPLPPRTVGGCDRPADAPPDELRLTVTAQPRPCDAALLLPLGGPARELRQVVSLSAASGKFTSPGARNNDAPAPCPLNAICPREDVGDSQLTLQQNAYSFDLATVENLPSRTGILAMIGLAWLVYCAGLLLASARMNGTTRWVAYGLSLAVWQFLSLRLLLSFRYALDPSALDKLAVEGVTRAFLGLTVVPGLLLLLARLRCDRYELPPREEQSRRTMMWAFYYLLALIAGGLIAFHLPPRLWSGLPPTYYVSLFDHLASFGGAAFIGILTAAALLLTLHIRYLYLPDDPKGETGGMFAKVFVSPWYWLEGYFADRDEFWAERLRGHLRPLAGSFGRWLFMFSVYVCFFLLARLLLPGDKTAQEMSVPILFVWLAVLWLGLRLFYIREREQSLTWRNYAVLAAAAVLMITVPAVCLPFLIADFGSIIPVLALTLPLTWLLVVILPTKARLCVALGVLLLFAGGILIYQNVEGLIPFEKQITSALPGSQSRGRLFARLLNYKQGTGAQRFAISATSIVGGEGLPYQELLNGSQHTWENKALAHAGGWWGMGFGEAPTRLSHVRQDTLQYDSVFSFFVASEFGMTGGVLLILLYAAPLVIVFLGGRQRFDGGYAVAFIVASAFLLEGLYHAGMNLGSFPMTGRNLPLLSVNSPSDLIRWTLLCGLAMTAIFWRHKGQASLNPESPSLISDAEPPRRRPAKSAPPPPEPLGKYSLVFWAVPCLFAAAVFSSGLQVLADADDELTTYSYEAILKEVKLYLDNDIVRYDGEKRRLILNKDRLIDPDVLSFINREVIRFNAQNEVERVEQFSRQYVAEVDKSLAAAGNLSQYNDALRRLGQMKAPASLGGVFRLTTKVDEEGEVIESSVQPNPDFNLDFSFRDGDPGAHVPKLKYGDQLLIGPAWVRGRTRTAVSAESQVPWVAALRDALLFELKRAGQDAPATAARYGALTLNPALHESAQRFTAARGLQLHERFLASRPINPRREPVYVQKLPPRVALSVVDLSGGATLALGGWPRMTSADGQWRMETAPDGAAEKSYWVPSAAWLDREAPAGVRTRYGGDRNFDRSLVMGSSTKPLWAAAVLRMHPELGDKLLVRGAGGTESSAFGVTIRGKEWKLNSRSDSWLDLSTYLKTSDNRYHVRLGLAGLAQGNNGTIKAGGASPSQDESLAGTPTPWRQYPAFTAPIKVAEEAGAGLVMKELGDPRQPNQQLAGSALAQHLRGMFSINTRRVEVGGRKVSEIAYRRSFWTKDENDDVATNTSRAATLFDNISPQAPDFAFDRLTRPRDFVTMLLGGGNNLWANVDLAAAFGSCLLGKPVVAHVIANDRAVKTLDGRKLLDPATALKLRPGLNAVAEAAGGTAYAAIRADSALSFLRRGGVKIYAKTGTLLADEDARATSRIVLALVKWKDEQKGEIEAGLVFSLVIEEGGTGTAAEWLREYLVEAETEITKLLNIEPSQTPPPQPTGAGARGRSPRTRRR